MTDYEHITLAHGNGGKLTRQLIENLFVRYLGNPLLNTAVDAAAVPLAAGENIRITTDSYTVQPLEFPGGDIGKLAVCGTVNDLAVSGATPRCITLNVIIEEGLPYQQLERVVRSMAATAKETGVALVAGDTKVVPRGQGGGLYLVTTGLGIVSAGNIPDPARIEAGDRILVSGPVGNHGTAVMLARESFGLESDLHSDVDSVLPLTRELDFNAGVRFLRDPTRGGVATVMHELVRLGGLSVQLDEAAIPVAEPVQSVCEMLGYDPLYLACEGRVVAVVAANHVERVLSQWRKTPNGSQAALIGQLQAAAAPAVVLNTRLGGQRFVDELIDDPLPRIC